MHVFVIERPYVSSGLKRTYHKKLEVFECTAVETSVAHPFAGWWCIDNIECVYTYHPKKGWLEKACTKYPGDIDHFTIIHHTPHLNGVVYATIEAAQVAKLLMIKRMVETYKASIKELEACCARNVPAYKDPLNQLLDQHPDLFL